ncbi:MAG TPA: SulP family inorganic anion transporter [Giesbergeria sp.]|nr:SulP family inorganic anion transporter [Giesbergeria sp.]HRA15223.1 SulP family inorganic anion transporter [Giesbergeria sp.]
MSFSFAFRPRILDALRGYSRGRWFADLGAGITVGIVALPLAMAFAIASGLKPEAGLWTAIIGGFLVALLGGTNVQIGGPAGAFIVIVYGIVERYGVAGLLISTACAGLLLFGLGLFRLGSLVRFVPVSIVIGFTNGIAVLIALSQVKDWLGLSIDKMPGNFFSQIHAIALHIGTVNPHALGLGVACLGGLFLWPRLFMHDSPVLLRLPEGHTIRSFVRIPAPVVALVSLTLLAHLMEYPVETIGSRFGGIPQQVPAFALPDLSWDTVRMLVTPTLTIALLGAIESLLCARVADQLATDPHHRKHDPNQELMAQGVANFVVPFFGGMPVTGTIARTVTNLRAGATTPVAGIVHALTLALIVLVAAPLALYIPLSVLAGILLFVAWNMGEWHEFARLRKFSNHYRLLMLGTFFLTVVFDLTVAVEVGLVLACALFVRRMSELFRAELQPSTPSAASATRLAWQLHGVLFFGAASKIDPIVQAIEEAPALTEVVLDARDLFALDTTGLEGLDQILKAVGQRGGVLWVLHAQEQPSSLMERSGFNARLAAQPPAAASPPGHSPSSGETPG